jgi:hypothetical protein
MAIGKEKRHQSRDQDVGGSPQALAQPRGPFGEGKPAGRPRHGGAAVEVSEAVDGACEADQAEDPADRVARPAERDDAADDGYLERHGRQQELSGTPAFGRDVLPEDDHGDHVGRRHPGRQRQAADGRRPEES